MIEQPRLFATGAYGEAVPSPSFAEAEAARDKAETPDEKTIQERFEKFHAENPEVYKELVRLAWVWKRAGRKKCGIRMLWERLRWDMALAKGAEEDFVLNDHYHSRFVRLMCEREPDLAGMFELRKLTA